VQVYLAIPKPAYERFIAKGGAVRGFELVRDPAGKPFPDAGDPAARPAKRR